MYIFEFISNPANDSKWRDSAVSGEVTSDGPIGTGSTIHSVDKLMGREIESTAEITVWDPPHKVGQKALDGPMPFEMLMTLESKEDGTHLSLSGQAEIGGFFKLAEGLVGRQLEKQMEKDLKGLKQYMEGGRE
jgi:hypothetical protein